jgi:hypothetical protein
MPSVLNPILSMILKNREQVYDVRRKNNDELRTRYKYVYSLSLSVMINTKAISKIRTRHAML